MTASLPMTAPLPVHLRESFPALQRVHGGQPVAYFDGPGGTQVPRAVVEAMADYLYHHNANTHWIYPTSVETDAAITAARRAMADFLNASPGDIAFGANMTTITFHLARALGRGWSERDTVVVTELDHQANVAPWQALARERGVKLRTVRFDPVTGTLDLDDLRSKLDGSVRLLAIGAASNALGTITDVAAAARLAHDVGALVFVDAVHYAPHALVEVRAFDCDFLACSAYKFYGPHIGVLYGRQQLVQELDVPKLLPSPDTAPERMETGTQNHEGMVGAAAPARATARRVRPAARTRLRARHAAAARTGRDAARATLRSRRRRAAHAHRGLHRARCAGRRRGAPPRGAGRLRLHGRLLRQHRGGGAGSGARRPGAGGLRVLHHRGRGGAAAGRRAADGVGAAAVERVTLAHIAAP